MIDKRGDINDQTPQPGQQVKKGFDKVAPKQPTSDSEACKLHDHPATRASDAVANVSKKRKDS